MEQDVIILVGGVVFFVILVTIGIVWMYNQKSTPRPSPPTGSPGTKVTPTGSPGTTRPSPPTGSPGTTRPSPPTGSPGTTVTPTGSPGTPTSKNKYLRSDLNENNYFVIYKGQDGIFRTFVNQVNDTFRPAILNTIGSGKYAIKSDKSKYCTDRGVDNFTCNSETAGINETFTIEKSSGNSIYLKNRFDKYCSSDWCGYDTPSFTFRLTDSPHYFDMIDEQLYYNGYLWDSSTILTTVKYVENTPTTEIVNGEVKLGPARTPVYGQLKLLPSGKLEYTSNSGQVTEYTPSIVKSTDGQQSLLGTAQDGTTRSFVYVMRQIEEFS
jgi:hypothetical protein